MAGLTFAGETIGNAYVLAADAKTVPADIKPVHRIDGSVVRFSGGGSYSRSYTATEWGLASAAAVQTRIDELRALIGTSGTLVDEAGSFSDMVLTAAAPGRRFATWFEIALTFTETL